MGLTVVDERLAPPAPGQARTYAVETCTEIRLPGGQQFKQTSAALVRHTVLEADPDGYLMELVTVELRPQAPTRQVELVTDIARNNSPLHVRTDRHGALLRVTNKAALAAQWQTVLPWLLTKYHDEPGAATLLAHVAAQYDSGQDQLEQGLAYKGPCAVLLPGFYGLHSWQGDARTDAKTVHQALGQSPLPLHVAWTATATGDDAFAPAVEVEGVGRLDRARVDESAWQDFLAQLSGGEWRGPPAPLQVFWREQYTVGR